MAASKKNYILVVTVGSQEDNQIYEDLSFGPFTAEEYREVERFIGDRFNGADVMAIGPTRLLSKTTARTMSRKEVAFNER